jgi:hypothetical protein
LRIEAHAFHSESKFRQRKERKKKVKKEKCYRNNNLNKNMQHQEPLFLFSFLKTPTHHLVCGGVKKVGWMAHY